MRREARYNPRQIFRVWFGHRIRLVVLPQFGEFTYGHIMVLQQVDFFSGSRQSGDEGGSRFNIAALYNIIYRSPYNIR